MVVTAEMVVTVTLVVHQRKNVNQNGDTVVKETTTVVKDVKEDLVGEHQLLHQSLNQSLNQLLNQSLSLLHLHLDVLKGTNVNQNGDTVVKALISVVKDVKEDLVGETEETEAEIKDQMDVLKLANADRNGDSVDLDLRIVMVKDLRKKALVHLVCRMGLLLV